MTFRELQQFVVAVDKYIPYPEKEVFLRILEREVTLKIIRDDYYTVIKKDIEDMSNVTQEFLDNYKERK